MDQFDPKVIDLTFTTLYSLYYDPKQYLQEGALRCLSVLIDSSSPTCYSFVVQHWHVMVIEDILCSVTWGLSFPSLNFLWKVNTPHQLARTKPTIF
jgi:hypothetical protein